MTTALRSLLAGAFALCLAQAALASPQTRAELATSAQTPDTVALLGFRAVGDLGAGAIYTSVGATPDGPEALKDGRGVWYNLVLTREVNVGWYGAYADDGAHKITAEDIAANPQWRGDHKPGDSWDTVATTEAIYAAFAGASTRGHIVWNSLSRALAANKALYVPQGAYGINEPLTIVGAFLTIDFASRGAAWDWQGSPAVSLLTTDSIAYAYIKDITLETSRVAVYGQAAPLWSMDHSGAYAGLKTQQVTIVDALIRTGFNGRGVAISPSGGGAQGDTITFLNPLFVGYASDQCLSLGGANTLSIMILDGDFQGCTHDAIHAWLGTVYVHGTSFQDQATGLDFTPVLSQLTTYGADVHILNGQGPTGVSKIQDARSEGEVPVNCEPGALCTVDDVQSAGAGILDWWADYPYSLGSAIGRVGSQGRTFMVVDDHGNGAWRAARAGASACEVVDPSGGLTPSAWVGERLLLRSDSGGTEHHIIAANTPTTLTLKAGDCLKRPVSDTALYHIGGITGSRPPAWDSAPRGGSPEANGDGQGFFPTPGSTDLKVGSEIYVRVQVGDYIVIPNADRLGVNAQLPAPFIARVLAKVGGKSLTLDKAPAAALSQAYGYWGAPVVDNQITYIDLDFNALSGAMAVQDTTTPQGRTWRLGRVANYDSGRPDWRRQRDLPPSRDAVVNLQAGAVNRLIAAPLDPAPIVDLAQALLSADDLVLTPTGDTRLDAPAPTVGLAREITLQVEASGTTPHAVSFGAHFKSAGPLSTGSQDGASFVVRFVSDGVTWNEESRSGPDFPAPRATAG